jgi:hypothetical protein
MGVRGWSLLTPFSCRLPQVSDRRTAGLMHFQGPTERPRSERQANSRHVFDGCRVQVAEVLINAYLACQTVPQQISARMGL